jgi:MerR family transcriptional regulator, copper efflux regulator
VTVNQSEAGSAPTPDPRRLPVACSLDTLGVLERIAQWRRALDSIVVGVARPQPSQLRLALADDAAGIARVVSLARAEKMCCPFFDFTLEIGTDVVTLVVEVPVGSEGLLEDFATLAPGG